MPNALVWDEAGKKMYEAGVSKGVLYPIQTEGAYSLGVAWNGLTSVSQNPTGGEANDIYADNIVYGSLMGTEKFEATIEAYMYPDEFMECDGSKTLQPGVYAGQQNRKTFGLCYRTEIGNDVDGLEKGYKLHMIYGAKASPAGRDYATINDSPEAITLSWDLTTTPVAVTGMKPTAYVEIDSTKADPDKLAALEAILYGSTEAEARLPLPDEIKTLMATP